MNTTQEVQHASRVIGTKFRIPNWSYDPSPALCLLPEPSPRTPEEVHPCPLEVQQYHDSLPCSIALDAPPPRTPPCPQCQGQRYNFTAYFHSGVFRQPPHELLAQIEKSYLLKDRLMSLLIGYVVHGDDIEDTDKQTIKASIGRWKLEVDGLVAQVRALGNDEAESSLREVTRWTNNMAELVWQHVCGTRLFEGIDRPGLRLRNMRLVTSEFRAKWELVWGIVAGIHASKGLEQVDIGVLVNIMEEWTGPGRRD